MGILRDKAKANSKFLLLDKGETVIVQLRGYKFVPSTQDPTKENVLFEFLENGVQRFWTNGSAKVWTALDSANPGDYVKITRGKKVSKDGVEDASKSVYSAELLVGYDPKTGQSMASNANVARTSTVASVNGNPGGITDPGEIVDPFGAAA